MFAHSAPEAHSYSPLGRDDGGADDRARAGAERPVVLAVAVAAIGVVDLSGARRGFDAVLRRTMAARTRGESNAPDSAADAGDVLPGDDGDLPSAVGVPSNRRDGPQLGQYQLL